MVQASIKKFHNLLVFDELLTTSTIILENKYTKSIYQQCTAKDENEQALLNQGTKTLCILIFFSSKINLFRIRQINNNPDLRAIIIATNFVNQSIPIFILASQHRRGKPLLKK
jgi:hypothetical protein